MSKETAKCPAFTVGWLKKKGCNAVKKLQVIDETSLLGKIDHEGERTENELARVRKHLAKTVCVKTALSHEKVMTSHLSGSPSR